MKNVWMATALAMVALTAQAQDQTALYDPMKERHKVVIPVDLLQKDKMVPIGHVVAVETKYGVVFYPNLKGLTPGLHGFHLHEFPDCGLTEKGLGMKAGGHWNPTKATRHSYPWDDNGHKGDLPGLHVAADGTATNPVLAPKLKSLEDVRGRSLMVHVGGDNHHDHPAVLGGGGARMACGVAK